METKIVPYMPIFSSYRMPCFKVYVKKVILRICKMTFWKWSLVAECFYYDDAKKIANTIEMSEAK